MELTGAGCSLFSTKRIHRFDPDCPIGWHKGGDRSDNRKKNGAYQSPEDLLKVEGIGARVLDLNKGNIRVERGAPAETAKKPAKDE